MKQEKLLLSIGIIFRDDIRCIERCLKALQPLRDTFPCELVMADTGSQDGSREIAEQYADELIDFPWIDDFSAARNAVMDRCSGKWFMAVDTDEYLREDSDLDQFRQFFEAADKSNYSQAAVVVRSYNSYEFEVSSYSDFLAIRVIRMSLGVRYSGTIHEHWDLPEKHVNLFPLTKIVYDHDGYVAFSSSSEEGRKKLERNVKLLRGELEKNPESLITRLQLIESGHEEPDFFDQIRRAVEMVKQKVAGWDQIGPSILRHAVNVSVSRKLPEADEWAAMAWEMFPDSLYIRLDAEYTLLNKSWSEKNYADCAERCERFLAAMEDYRAGKDATARLFGVINTAGPFQERGVKIILASAYTYEKNLERALEVLSELDCSAMNGGQMMNILKSAQELHFRSELDTEPLIRGIWESLNKPTPTQQYADSRVRVFNLTADRAFTLKNRRQELTREDFKRHAYTLYLPLRDVSEVGIAAEVMDLEDTAELENALYGVNDWDAFPADALAHALEWDVRFPLPDKPLPIEEMDSLARRLAKQKEEGGEGGETKFFSMVLQQCQSVPFDWQTLTWQRGLLMGAIRAFDWEKKPEEGEAELHNELGMSIARAFAQTERAFIPRYYTPETLTGDNISVLPPMHRFGWYCAQAFEALDRGAFPACLQSLRAGMSVYKDIAKLVEFVMDRVVELEKSSHVAAAPPELVELAKQVKLMLSRFAPDDPAVLELKNSPAYQQVAWLIEDPASTLPQ